MSLKAKVLSVVSIILIVFGVVLILFSIGVAFSFLTYFSLSPVSRGFIRTHLASGMAEVIVFNSSAVGLTLRKVSVICPGCSIACVNYTIVKELVNESCCRTSIPPKKLEMYVVPEVCVFHSKVASLISTLSNIYSGKLTFDLSNISMLKHYAIVAYARHNTTFEVEWLSRISISHIQGVGGLTTTALIVPLLYSLVPAIVGIVLICIGIKIMKQQRKS